MEAFLQGLGWKKGGALLIAVAVIGFGVITLLTLSADVPKSESTVPENIAEYEPTSTPNPDGSNVVPTTAQNQPVRWVFYDGPTFTLFHPEDYAPTQQDGDNAQTVIFLPYYGDSDPTQHRIEITARPSSQQSAQDAINSLKASGLTEDTAIIDETVAPRLKGFVGGYLQQKTVVYEKNGTVYQLSLFYPSNQEITALEEIFSTLTAGFRVK